MSKTNEKWILTVGLIVPLIAMVIPVVILYILAVAIGVFLMFWIKREMAYFLILPVFALVFFLLVISGFTHFEFLPQLKVFVYTDPIELFVIGHHWAPRFLVSYPAVLLSIWSNADIDLMFTLFGLLLLLIYVWLSIAAGSLFRNDPQLKNAHISFGLISLLSMAALSIMMNGRLVAAFLGVMILLYLQMRKSQQRQDFSVFEYVLFFVGFSLSTVSSGTMMVTFAQIMIVSPIILIMNKLQLKRFLLFSLLFLIATGPLVLKMASKNLKFYGGGFSGFYQMLSHGLGVVFMQNTKIVIVVMISILPILYVFVRILKKMKRDEPALFPVFLSLPICLGCGLFGISTALMIIPSLLLLMSYFISKVLNLENIKIWG